MNLVRGKITLTFIKETKNFENGFQKSKRKKRPSKKHGMKREKKKNYIQELKVNFSTALLRWLCIQIP